LPCRRSWVRVPSSALKSLQIREWRRRRGQRWLRRGCTRGLIEPELAPDFTNSSAAVGRRCAACSDGVPANPSVSGGGRCVRIEQHGRVGSPPGRVFRNLQKVIADARRCQCGWLLRLASFRPLLIRGPSASPSKRESLGLSSWSCGDCRLQAGSSADLVRDLRGRQPLSPVQTGESNACSGRR
jgi:hypothetical protein